jgi:hypothetical protein
MDVGKTPETSYMSYVTHILHNIVRNINVMEKALLNHLRLSENKQVYCKFAAYANEKH